MKYRDCRFFRAGFIFLFLFIQGMLCCSYEAAAGGAEDSGDETMLMFVGEDLDVLSLASRRQESAWQAPAVARVITRKEFREQGRQTLSHVLRDVPGFYMARKEWGTQPYLRGIPNSVLLLYDTAPLGSDLSKLIHPMDHDLSLAGVKRIEIVSGPGSVLWGPDAFGGIINLVPLSGRDVNGAETGVLYGAPGDRTGVWMNIGQEAGPWDALISVSVRDDEEDDASCNVIRFWQNDRTAYPPAERYGETFLDDNQYLEATGRLSYKDWFSLLGRISDNQTSYVMSDGDGNLSWKEERRVPSGFIKLEAKKMIDHASAFRWTGYYSYMAPEIEIIDYLLDQKERTTYAEMIYDHSFFSRQGLLTAGVSFREKQTRNAPIWDGYLPEYLGPENESLTPLVFEEDYTTRLRSVFGQYRQKVGDVDVWLGARFDDHDTYEDHISVSAGAAWSPTSQWMIKLLGGTAYRTPFARQLLQEETPDLEKIKSGNVSVAWKPSPAFSAEICGFISRIENHIVEDLYYGLSEPNEQEITGIEAALHWRPHKRFGFSSNITLTDNSGPNEQYYYNDHIIILPDGGVMRNYEELEYPYDAGPDTLFKLSGLWRPHDQLSFFLNLRYISSTELIYPVTGYPDPVTSQVITGSSGWLCDATVTLTDVGFSGLDLQVSLKNLTDRDFMVPGTYSMIEVDPVYAEIRFIKKW